MLDSTSFGFAESDLDAALATDLCDSAQPPVRCGSREGIDRAVPLDLPLAAARRRLPTGAKRVRRVAARVGAGRRLLEIMSGVGTNAIADPIADPGADLLQVDPGTDTIADPVAPVQGAGNTATDGYTGRARIGIDEKVLFGLPARVALLRPAVAVAQDGVESAVAVDDDGAEGDADPGDADTDLLTAPTPGVVRCADCTQWFADSGVDGDYDGGEDQDIPAVVTLGLLSSRFFSSFFLIPGLLNGKLKRIFLFPLGCCTSSLPLRFPLRLTLHLRTLDAVVTTCRTADFRDARVSSSFSRSTSLGATVLLQPLLGEARQHRAGTIVHRVLCS